MTAIERPTPRCSIVIPVFNNCFFTRLCLQALQRCRAAAPSFEVIIVDNGSTDGTAEVLAEFAPELARVIRNPTNRGFAIASNQGAKIAQGQYVVFLNNDAIVEPGWLQALVSVAESDPAVGAVGGRLLYPDGTIQHAGVVFDREHHPQHAWSGYPANWPEALSSRDYQAVTGACLLLEKQLFDTLGGFDEGYQNSYEDIDLCFRIRGGGKRISYCANAVIYHFESTTPSRSFRDDRNLLRFLERWDSSITVDFDPSAPHPTPGKSAASSRRLEFAALAKQAQELTRLNAHLTQVIREQPWVTMDAQLLAEGWPGDEEFDLLYRPSAIWAVPRATIVSVPILLINRGRHRWPAGRLRLSYHWRVPGESAYLIPDGQRTEIPQPVEPGEVISLVATITTPSVAATYALEWDAVEEGVAWLSERGIVPYRQQVRVIATAPERIIIDRLPTELTIGEAIDVEARCHGVANLESDHDLHLGGHWIPRGTGPPSDEIQAFRFAANPPPEGAAQDHSPLCLQIRAPRQPGHYALQFYQSSAESGWVPIPTLGGEANILNGSEPTGCLPPFAQSTDPNPERESGLRDRATAPDANGAASLPRQAASAPPLALGTPAIEPGSPSEPDQQRFADEFAYLQDRLRRTLGRERRQSEGLRAELAMQSQANAHLQSLLDQAQRQNTELADLLDRYRNGRLMRLLTTFRRFWPGST